jgi:hypothetical protein
MRAGNAYHRIKFYAKVTTRDVYGASSDTWPIATISTRGEVRYTGGNKTLSNEEKFYSKSVELIVRYRSTIVETMKIQIDGSFDLWFITFMEVLGRNESIRLTIEKCNDGLDVTPTLPPTGFAATVSGSVYNTIDLTWSNNAANDGVIIERSINGIDYTEITRIAKAIVPVTHYHDEDLLESTRYFYRIKAFNYYNYSAFAAVDDATTNAEPA